MTALSTDYTFGIEIEFKGVRTTRVAEALGLGGVLAHVRAYGNHSPVRYWKVTTDATVTTSGYSLGTGDGVGGELISPILKGDAGLAKLKRVLEVLNSLPGLKVDVKCGIHVHLGRPDGWMVEHVQAIFRRYAAFESDFDGIMPHSRRGSRGRYCLSIAGDARSVASHRGSDLSGLARCASNAKFRKVNLQPLKRVSKTIEFRQHSGSTDYEKIANWVRLLVAFAETSRTMAPRPTSTITQATATGKINLFYKRRRRIAYGEIREQIAAQGWDLRFAGGSGSGVKYKLYNADGVWVQTYRFHQLEALYNTPSDELVSSRDRRLNRETAQTFWDSWFTANEPVEAVSNDGPQTPDTIFNGVDAELITFFTRRRAALA